MAAEHCILFIKAVPAFALAAGKNFGSYLWTLLYGNIYLVGNIAVGSAYDSGDAGSIEAVNKIMLLQLIRSRYGDSAYFVESQNRKPKLVMPFWMMMGMAT